AFAREPGSRNHSGFGCTTFGPWRNFATGAEHSDDARAEIRIADRTLTTLVGLLGRGGFSHVGSQGSSAAVIVCKRWLGCAADVARALAGVAHVVVARDDRV